MYDQYLTDENGNIMTRVRYQNDSEPGQMFAGLMGHAQETDTQTPIGLPMILRTALG